MLQDTRYETNFIAPTHKPYVHNLHLTVKDFLDQGYDYLLLMDDDNPPTNNPLDLVELDHDIIGLPTPVWHSGKPGDRPYFYNAMRELRDDFGCFLGYYPVGDRGEPRPTGLVECDAVGTGCVLIARRVLEAIQAPFMRHWTEEGLAEVGNDFAFCQCAKASGYKIWAHFDYICQHFNTLELNETIHSLLGMSR